MYFGTVHILLNAFFPSRSSPEFSPVTFDGVVQFFKARPERTFVGAVSIDENVSSARSSSGLNNKGGGLDDDFFGFNVSG